MGIIQGLGERMAKSVFSLRSHEPQDPNPHSSSSVHQLPFKRTAQNPEQSCGPGASADSSLACVESAKLAGASVRHILPLTAESTGEA